MDTRGRLLLRVTWRSGDVAYLDADWLPWMRGDVIPPCIAYPGAICGCKVSAGVGWLCRRHAAAEKVEAVWATESVRADLFNLTKSDVRP